MDKLARLFERQSRLIGRLEKLQEDEQSVAKRLHKLNVKVRRFKKKYDL